METPKRDQRLHRERRVRKKNEFDRVFKTGTWGSNDVLRLKLCRNELQDSRVGVSVSKRSGNAVVRNLLKRRFKEAFRSLRAELPAGIDIVLLPSNRTPRPSLQAIKAALPPLIRETLSKYDYRQRKGKRREG